MIRRFYFNGHVYFVWENIAVGYIDTISEANTKTTL
jgi:hypothetical protein